jgi:hypothetical protein
MDVADPRRQLADDVPVVGDRHRLAHGEPVVDAVAEALEQHRGELGHPAGTVAVQPAPAVGQRLGELPRVDDRHWRHPRAEQLVDQPVVEIQPLGVHASRAVRQDPRPRRRELVRGQAELAHDRDVLAVPRVVVAGHVLQVAADDVARRAREAVPHRPPGAVRQQRAFHLLGRRRGPPQEAVGESDRARRHFAALPAISPNEVRFTIRSHANRPPPECQAGAPVRRATSSRTAGATSAPSSSIARSTSRWARSPTLSWARKR